MRTFYIFKIQKDMTILTKETPYNLYRSIENLYYYDSVNSTTSSLIFHDLFMPFNKEYIDKKIENSLKNNRYYVYDGEKHIINNKYKPEYSLLKVYKSHIILKSNVINPTLLFNYLMSDNLFVCDFKNKDYFWLNEFVR